MQVIYQCPGCQQRVLNSLQQPDEAVRCDHCDWHRAAPDNVSDNEAPRVCRVCGCDDLWRQKDFPPALGLVFVGLGILLSSIAWAWHMPGTAIGILMVFAVIDLVLFALMPDMLVCYRCAARHRRSEIPEDHPAFDLEISERYRQQELRAGGHTG